MAPRRKMVKEMRRIGFRPKDTESAWNIGWKIVEQRRKVVARRNVGVVEACRAVAMACVM
jgi:hypothetical protein